MLDNRKKVLVVGASPDSVNQNTIMRSFVVEGFVDLFGNDYVEESPLEYSYVLAKKFEPNLIVAFGSCMPDECDYSLLRKACDELKIPLIFWLHDDPYEIDFNYRAISVADYIFSNDKWATEFYNHPNSYHLPMAASKSAHFRPQTCNTLQDFFFCGVAFPNRQQLIGDIAPLLRKYKTTILGADWPIDECEFTENRRVGNSELSDYYQNSKFVINIGRDFNLANDRYQLVPSTPGPRTFEAAMAGAVQLYFVESMEIVEYFEDGSEILLFDDLKGLTDIVERLAENPEARNSIGKNAQRRALKEHTYYERIKSMLEVIDI